MDTLPAGALYDFLIALFIGALVGIEREQKKALTRDVGLGGIRTFILVAMAGAVAGWLSDQLASPWIFAASLVIVAALVLAGYVLTVKAGSASPGLTSEIAALVVYLLGGTVMFGWQSLAVGLGIVTAAVLAFKEPLHGFVGKIGREDIYAALKLLIASFIVLPLLPNETVDPLGALNPYGLWLLVILISALGFTGYVAVRLLGQTRGTAITGVFGGLVSSTAVTLSFSRRSREEEGHHPPQGEGSHVFDALAAGILLSWVVMFGRIVVEVAVVHRALLGALMQPLAAMALVATAAGAFYFRRGAADSRRAMADGEVPFSNPFSLTAAIKFALFFAAVLLVVEVVKRNLPGQGLYLVAGLAGLTDVDAITLSMASFARDGGDAAVAVTAIGIAAMTNTVVKAAMVATLAAAALRTRILAAAVAVVTGGVLAVLV
jgi:uncharacterized membrane protein (DUF4010 family)